MKRITKIASIIILLSVTIGHAGCTNSDPKKEIKEVAYNYLMAMANYKVDEAEPYCTRETSEGILVRARQMVAGVEAGYIESDTPAKIYIKKVTLLSDTTAIVSYKKRTPLKKMEDELVVVLEDGKWKAHVPLRKRAAKAKPTTNQRTIEVDTVIEIDGKKVVKVKRD